MKKLLLLSALVAAVVTSEAQASGAVRKFFLMGVGVGAASACGLRELVNLREQHNREKEELAAFNVYLKASDGLNRLEQAINKEAAAIEKVWGGGFDHSGVPLWVGEELKKRGLSVERVKSRQRKLDEERAFLDEIRS